MRPAAWMNREPFRTVLSAWTWLGVALGAIISVPPALVISFFTRKKDPGQFAAGLMFRKMGVIAEKFSPMWRFRITGNIPDDPRRPYVIVANHESFADILAIATMPFEMKWISKRAIFKYPLVGTAMRAVGDIPVDREDPRAGVQVIRAAIDRLDKRVSVMIFPEGTRSKDGEMLDFKTGAFRIAIQAGVPILPIALNGTREALVKHNWRCGAADAEIRVLDPISTEGLTKKDSKELCEKTRDIIAAAVADMKASNPQPGQ